MEALDQLLMACHCQSINLFVESFLKMVAKLLESEKPNLQILGTNSFVKFANIEEDTPSYHRSYDFFVSRFSEMCHSSHADPDVRARSGNGRNGKRETEMGNGKGKWERKVGNGNGKRER
ncbi:protein EFR3 B-like protein [Turdus rufiventris]|nr:protein EFR3 B-like protein [Turdus rufiventris]